MLLCPRVHGTSFNNFRNVPPLYFPGLGLLAVGLPLWDPASLKIGVRELPVCISEGWAQQEAQAMKPCRWLGAEASWPAQWGGGFPGVEDVRTVFVGLWKDGEVGEREGISDCISFLGLPEQSSTTGCQKQQYVSQFWRLDVQDQCIGRRQGWFLLRVVRERSVPGLLLGL